MEERGVKEEEGRRDVRPFQKMMIKLLPISFSACNQTRAREGGGRLQHREPLCDWVGLKCSTAVLCCTACFAAVIYRLSQRMSATVECRIGFDFQGGVEGIWLHLC